MTAQNKAPQNVGPVSLAKKDEAPAFSLTLDDAAEVASKLVRRRNSAGGVSHFELIPRSKDELSAAWARYQELLKDGEMGKDRKDGRIRTQEDLFIKALIANGGAATTEELNTKYQRSTGRFRSNRDSGTKPILEWTIGATKVEYVQSVADIGRYYMSAMEKAGLIRTK